MEDRKRPAMGDQDDSAPPLKRQATAINGTKTQPDGDVPWKDEIETFQKDAILRQMREYKREKSSLEVQLRDLQKQSLFHDDHIRIIDAWFQQLLDEIKIVASSAHASDRPTNDDETTFESSLLFSDNETFQQHLKDRSSKIRSCVSALYSKLPDSGPEARDLQERLSKLLASEKAHITELQKLTSEKEQLSERLDKASYRYMVAEKKLDRAKSAVVARLEKQALQSSKGGAGSAPDGTEAKDKATHVNGTSEREADADLEVARKIAEAAAKKRAEQVDELEGLNKSLSDELSALNTKLVSLTDDDYAKTELFKVIRTQHEDVIKRVNQLEATNAQLREEARKLLSERTAYQTQLDEESQAVISEVEGQLTKAEANLARIRNSRDELMAEVAIKKAALEQRRTALQQVEELSSARESRINALESEVGRARASKETNSDSAPSTDAHVGLSADVLRARVTTLEKELGLLSNELPSMEAAWKKAQSLAAKKVSEVASWEEQVAKLTAEKAKADQKYFGAMKAKEMREAEIRTLRIQNSKTSEIVSKLKEAESSCRGLISNLEKQLAEAKESVTDTSNQQRILQQRITEMTLTAEGLAMHNAELKEHLLVKDKACAEASHARRQADVEVEQLKASLEETKKGLESWKKRGLGNNSDEYEALRTIAICTVCRKNFKNTAIKSCGHIFCQDCVDERITSRSRKCPNCGKSFGANDHMRVTL